MRINLTKNGSQRRKFAGTIAALLLGGCAAVAQTFTSPVGNTWDVIMSGSRQGIALMNFNDDGTFTMDEVLLYKLKGSGGGSSDDSRGTGGDDSRGGPPVNTNGLPVHTNLYGAFFFPSDTGLGSPNGELNFTNEDGSAVWLHNGEPAGRWSFDISGRLIGFFTETSAPHSITTNLVPTGTNICCPYDSITNGIQFQTNVTFLTNVEFLRLTNSISFVGRVSRAGNRLTLLASTPAGKASFVGLPQIDLADVSGNWYATKWQAGLPYTEFFTLTSGAMNVYTWDGDGPGYTYNNGIAIVSRQRKIALAARIVTPHNPPGTDKPEDLKLRVVYGPVNLRRPRFITSGLEGLVNAPVPIRLHGFLSPLP